MQSANSGREETPPNATESPTEPPPSTAKPARRRPRWGRRIIVLLVLLIVGLAALVALAPTLLSTNAGRDAILSVANDKLQGSLAVGDLSIAWFGQCVAQDVKASDPQGREVLAAKRVTFAGGVWDAVGAMQRLEQITIESPQAVLYLAEDGTVSLAQTFLPKQPAPAKKDDAPTSIPDGGITVRDGVVRVIRADGRTYEVPDIDADIQLGRAGSVKGNVQLTLADGGKVTADLNLADFLSNGRIDVDAASAHFRLQTDEKINVGPIGDFALSEPGTRGQVDLAIEATYQSGKLSADLRTDVEQLASSGALNRPVAPVSLSLRGKVEGDKDNLAGRMSVDGDVGHAEATFAYSLAERPETIPTALLEGEGIHLPDLKLSAKAGVDLPALAKALPGILQVQPGTEITGGRVEIADLSIQGGATPAVTASINVTELTAKTDGRDVRCDPIGVEVDALVEAGQGLLVRRAQVESGFAHIVARGTSSELKATIDGDLNALQQQIGQVFDLGEASFAGDLLAQIEVSRAQGDDLGFAMELSAQGLRYKTGNGELAMGLALVNNEGVVSFTNRERPRLELKKASVDLDGQVQAHAAGWYDFQAGTFQAEAGVEQADLAFLGRQASAVGVDALAGHSGRLSFSTQIGRSDAGAPIVSDGQLQGTDLRLDGNELTQTLSGKWSGVRFSSQERSLGVDSANLESAFAQLAAEGVTARFGDELTLDGRMRCEADLARCATLAARLTETDEPPPIAGRLTLNTVCKSGPTGFAATGDGNINDFTYQTGDTTINEQVRLAYDVTLNHRDERIAVRNLDIQSGLASTQLTGTIEQYSTSMALAIDGQYELAWKQATDLLHDLSPSTAETITLAGKSSGKISAKGPIRQANVKPAFRDLTVRTGLGWDSAEVYGVSLGKTALSPSLAKGTLTIPETALNVAGGKVRIGGSIDLRPDALACRIPGTLAVLENIKITPQLGRELLGRINPVFSKATRVSGIASLLVRDLNLPLGEAITSGGSGGGELQLKNTKLQPGGLMAQLVKLGGMGTGEMYTVRFSGLNFTLKDGRIHYKDFTMTFADNAFDLVYYGSVGFDDTVNLIVSVPVRPALLERLGVSGPTEEYARKLAGRRVELPIVGTRENPELDLSKVDVTKLLQDVLKEGLLEQGKKIDKKDLTDPSRLLEETGLLGDDKGKKESTGQTKGKGKGKGTSKDAGSGKKGAKGKDEKGGAGDLLDDLTRKSKKKKSKDKD